MVEFEIYESQLRPDIRFKYRIYIVLLQIIKRISSFFNLVSTGFRKNYIT